MPSLAESWYEPPSISWLWTGPGQSGERRPSALSSTPEVAKCSICLLSGNTYDNSPEDFKLWYYVILNCLMTMRFGSLCLDWSGYARLCCSNEETLTAPCLCVFSQAKSNAPELLRLSCGAAHGTRGLQGSSQCLSPGVTHGTSPQGPLVERACGPA